MQRLPLQRLTFKLIKHIHHLKRHLIRFTPLLLLAGLLCEFLAILEPSRLGNHLTAALLVALRQQNARGHPEHVAHTRALAVLAANLNRLAHA